MAYLHFYKKQVGDHVGWVKADCTTFTNNLGWSTVKRKKFNEERRMKAINRMLRMKRVQRRGRKEFVRFDFMLLVSFL